MLNFLGQRIEDNFLKIKFETTKLFSLVLSLF